MSIQCKKGNIVPINKKDDKQTLKNYRPVSLPPICGKDLEVSKSVSKQASKQAGRQARKQASK